MLNWIRKKLGYHVCEEFTQWRTMTAHYSRPAEPLEPGYATCQEVSFTVEFQERQCTICGQVFRKRIDARLS